VIQQPWDGDWITYNIDGLPAGVYEYTLQIFDAFGFNATDTVIVTVFGSTTATINPVTSTTTSTTTNGTTYLGVQEITLVISIGSTVVIVVVIILMLRTKKTP